MATEWVIAEWFEPDVEPSVIAVGQTVKNFVPLDRILSSQFTLRQARAAIVEAARTLQRIERISEGHRTIVVPLLLSPTQLHGVVVWSGPADDPVPPRSPAGAWCFDMRYSISTRSDDLLAIMGIPAEQWDRVRSHSIASMFSRPYVVNHENQRAALTRLVREVHGTTTQAMWAVARGSDGEQRALHYSCRQLDESDSRGKIHHLVRGITHDIGPAAEVPAVPPRTTLAHQILEATASDGRYRALVNPHTLHLLQWQGPPMPGIAWQAYVGEPPPELHPDDIAIARAMARRLDDGDVTGRIRVRALDKTWTTLDVHATSIPLDGSTTAALVTIRLAVNLSPETVPVPIDAPVYSPRGR